jgi:adenylosuccinate lyase
VLRNIGVPMGHTLIGFESTLKGLNKLLLNEPKFHEDLEKNWQLLKQFKLYYVVKPIQSL